MNYPCKPLSIIVLLALVGGIGVLAVFDRASDDDVRRDADTRVLAKCRSLSNAFTTSCIDSILAAPSRYLLTTDAAERIKTMNTLARGEEFAREAIEACDKRMTRQPPYFMDRDWFAQCVSRSREVWNLRLQQIQQAQRIMRCLEQRNSITSMQSAQVTPVGAYEGEVNLDEEAKRYDEVSEKRCACERENQPLLK